MLPAQRLMEHSALVMGGTTMLFFSMALPMKYSFLWMVTRKRP
jgi:hypothetical protein